MSAATMRLVKDNDEDLLSKVIAPLDPMERCARCSHAGQDHIDRRDNTVRGCRHQNETQKSYGQRCDCQGFLLWFIREWPGGRLFQVKTKAQVGGTWSYQYSRRYIIPIDYTPRPLTLALLFTSLAIATFCGAIIGACAVWMFWSLGVPA